MRAALLAGIALLTFGSPAIAQHHGHAGHMPGMTMPAKPAARPAPKRKPAARKAQSRTAPKPATRRPARRAAATRRVPATDPHAGHDMATVLTAPASQVAADPHAGHDMGATQSTPAAPTSPDPHAGHHLGGMTSHDGPTGTNLPAGNAVPPVAFPGSAAARFYGAERMENAAHTLRREHGGGMFSQLIFNLAELQVRDGRDGYRWDAEGWVGGDIDRLAIKTEGAGDFGRPVDDAEVQLLYSRALDPYVNLQAGVRYDFKPNPSRAYASVGFEALAPYWFDVEGTVFLSDKGDVLARAEAYYDQRITNWLVLQPRAELNFAAQDVPSTGIGSGLSDIELGLRLRYEVRREFAPYVGVSWDRKLGDTARFARADGERTGGFGVVAGLRTWF